jgi:hypothetical protein
MSAYHRQIDGRDRPALEAAWRAAANAKGLATRVSVISGDFFESLPPADLYLLKFILHDWDDSSCVKILSNCARSLRRGGRVVVIEIVLGAVGEPGFGPLVDLNMLVLNPGRERSADEYGRLFDQAGLKLQYVKATSSPFSIIEATIP